MSGMLASALLSSIDGRLLYAVVGQFPLRQQSTVGAISDQGVQALHNRLLERLFLGVQSKSGELDREHIADRDIGARLEAHQVGKRLTALYGGVKPSLP